MPRRKSRAKNDALKSLQTCWDKSQQEWPPDTFDEMGESILFTLSDLRTEWSCPPIKDWNCLWLLVGSGVAEVCISLAPNYENNGKGPPKSWFASFITSGCNRESGLECLKAAWFQTAGICPQKLAKANCSQIDDVFFFLHGLRLTNNGYQLARELAMLTDLPRESKKSAAVWSKLFAISPLRIESCDLSQNPIHKNPTKSRGYFNLIQEIHGGVNKLDADLGKWIRVEYSCLKVKHPVQDLLPDGPFDPLSFRFGLKTVELAPADYRGLCAMWAASQVDIKDFYIAAKGDHAAEWTEGAINGFRNRINFALDRVNYPKRIGKVGKTLIWK